MPATPTLTRNWQEQARTLIAAGMSVRRAARELGLPEDRVRKWAERAKVCQTVTTVTMSPMSPAVPTAADILAKQGPDTRAKLSTAVNKTATHFAEQTGEQLAQQTTEVLQTTKAAGSIYSWQEQAPGQQVMVNVNLLGVELPVVEVAQVLDAEALPVSIEQRPE